MEFGVSVTSLRCLSRCVRARDRKRQGYFAEMPAARGPPFEDERVLITEQRSPRAPVCVGAEALFPAEKEIPFEVK